MSLIDIAANLTDSVFRGEYGNKKVHDEDLEEVLKRAWEVGVDKIIVTATNLTDAKNALQIVSNHPNLYSTVGVHPTHCQEFEEVNNAEKHLESLLELIRANQQKVVAIGEFGLDFDRLHFCPKDVQLRYFEKQFWLAEQTQLPLFLHLRNADAEFLDIVRRNRDKFKTGVVHSFTSSESVVDSLVDLDLFIGINGCSLKTEENLKAMARIPIDRLMIETDAPYCEIRPSMAAHKYSKNAFLDRWECRKKEKFQRGALVKGRNEPAFVRQILQVIARYRDIDEEHLTQQIYKNTCSVFFSNQNSF